MALTLGIDFGGTKILAGVIDTSSGEVVATAKKRTRAEKGTDDVVKRLLAAVDEALDAAHVPKHEIDCVGVGVAGQVDAQKGTLIRAPNLPAELLGGTILTHLHDHVNASAYLYNDVAAAAAGEVSFGAGKGHPDFVCIFVGTGIGGSVYTAGKPFGGATNTAGELGHIVVDFDGRLCGCGGRGHLEAYASRTAMVRALLASMRLGRKTSLSEVDPAPNPDDPAHSPIRSRALSEAVDAGDELAIEVIEDGARYLGAGLVSIINFYNPPRIILGGGVVGAVDRYFKTASSHAKREALLVPRDQVEIVKAALEDNSGIVGAAVLARQAHEAA